MENDVIAEETATDIESEEQTEIEESPEDTETFETETETEDNASEEVNKTDESIKEPKSKANERIRELVKERNEWREKYTQAIKGRPDNDGIAEDGIDPKAFKESLKSELQAENAEKNLSRSDAVLAREAMRDFDFMSDPIWQDEAQNYVNKGYDPYTAAEMVGKKINYLRGIEKKNVEKQVKAEQKLKNGAYQTSGQSKSVKPEFTREDIANMSDAEYEANREKIMKTYKIKI